MNGYTKDTLNILGIIHLVYGILLCITIVGCIFGIPMIIGANKYRAMSEEEPQALAQKTGSIWGWGIFFGIVDGVFPLGLIIWIFVYLSVDEIEKQAKNQVQENQNATEKKERTIGEAVQDTASDIATGIVNGTTSIINDIKGTVNKKKDEHLQEELQRLQKLNESGQITDEEYEELRKKKLGLDK